MRPLILLTLATVATLAGCGGAPAPTSTPSSAPAQAAAPADAGLTVLHQPSSSPIVELRFVFRAGSAYDPPGREGTAWLLAHLLTEGGTQDLTYPELLSRLYPWAAQIGTQVDKEQLTIVARVHREHVDAFYPLLRDVLLAPRLDAADFERLRTQAVTRLTQNMRTANDEELAKLVLEAQLFAGTPYAHPSIGTEAGLKALTLDDLKAWRATALTRDRLVIGLGGAADDALVARVRQDFAGLPAHGTLPDATPAPAPPPTKPRLIVIDQPQAGATAMAFGHVADFDRRSADFPAMALAASYFGEHRQFHGVLFQQIREKRGMNYGDYAYAEAFVQEGWGRMPRTNIARRHQHTSVWIRPVPNEDRHFALRIALRLFGGLVADGLTAEAVAATRQFLEGYVYLQLQTDQRRLGTAIDDAFYGLPEPYALGLGAGMKPLDAPAVKAALGRHLHPEALTIVVVTPDAAGFVDAVVGDAPSPKAYASPKPTEITDEDAIIARLPLGIGRDQVAILPAATLFAN